MTVCNYTELVLSKVQIAQKDKWKNCPFQWFLVWTKALPNGTCSQELTSTMWTAGQWRLETLEKWGRMSAAVDLSVNGCVFMCMRNTLPPYHCNREMYMCLLYLLPSHITSHPAFTGPNTVWQNNTVCWFAIVIRYDNMATCLEQFRAPKS